MSLASTHYRLSPIHCSRAKRFESHSFWMFDLDLFDRAKLKWHSRPHCVISIATIMSKILRNQDFVWYSTPHVLRGKMFYLEMFEYLSSWMYDLDWPDWPMQGLNDTHHHIVYSQLQRLWVKFFDVKTLIRNSTHIYVKNVLSWEVWMSFFLDVCSWSVWLRNTKFEWHSLVHCVLSIVAITWVKFFNIKTLVLNSAHIMWTNVLPWVP